jgi:hypothetical protein
MPLIDNETRTIIIQKTWCHGQLLAPLYGLLCWIWFFRQEQQQQQTNNDNIYYSTVSANIILIYSGIILPLWCYVSYRNVFIKFSSRVLLIGGILVEIAYISVFVLSIQEIHRISSFSTINNTTTNNYNLSKSYFMLMTIASGLFAIETFVFILVATTLHKHINNNRSQQQDSTDDDDYDNDYHHTDHRQYYDKTLQSSNQQQQQSSNSGFSINIHQINGSYNNNNPNITTTTGTSTGSLV